MNEKKRSGTIHKIQEPGEATVAWGRSGQEAEPNSNMVCVRAANRKYCVEPLPIIKSGVKTGSKQNSQVAHQSYLAMKFTSGVPSTGQGYD